MQLLKIALIASISGFASNEAKAGPQDPPQSPIVVETHGSQWITTSDGCSYSRTQAPGYPVQWMLILNPHHIGKPDAHIDCAPMLQG